jgi:2-oxoisovalerate dehydrogenase E1 component alpha subunit
VEIPALTLSSSFVRDLYSRMLLTRIIDEDICRLHPQDSNSSATSCRGREALQIGSAVCIEIGNDFTLPYYRDLGVVLTIGMTPDEVFRASIQEHRLQQASGDYPDPEQFPAFSQHRKVQDTLPYWGYQKHNMVNSSASIATQVLHAAGIAFAVKLRKAPIVAVTYCGDGAVGEADFLEGITFAGQQHLPFVCIYEQDDSSQPLSDLPLPTGLVYAAIDGIDVIAVHTAMHAAMDYARAGNGPVLLEMILPRSSANTPIQEETRLDPLIQCQHYLEAQGAWDEQWAAQLREQLTKEAKQALQDAA